MIKTIEQQIAETDLEQVMASLPGEMPFMPYPYQLATHWETTKEIRSYQAPFIVKAAVSAGKTILISLVARRLRDIQRSALILSRQGEIVEQDHEEMTNFSVPNSIFCASLGKKSNFYPIISGSEGTIVNSLHSKLKDFYPQFLLIDECHHVDITDILDSEQEGEVTLEDMRNRGADNNLAPGYFRKSYTVIIRELQRRCMERYRKPLVVIGYTGTDYRGVEPIINEDVKTPGFWRKKIVDINTEFLVKFGSVVPTTFGATHDLGYDLKEFHSDGSEGDSDYSTADMAAMQRRILEDMTMTRQIMDDVHLHASGRNGVLVTCAGLKHCQEAAAALPDGVTYGIVTEDTSKKERQRILSEAKKGLCKYVFQVGCLTTGINCPPWDTIVILRRIGSLTLLVQLIGRGMRILKQSHIDAGIVKTDNLVLDYAGTMNDLADLYFSPFTEQYQYEEAVRNNDTIPCPKCQTENSIFARRCIAEDSHSSDGRCEYFFKSRTCDDIEHPRIKGLITNLGCGAENDIAARFCRKCSNMLIDPNKKLSGKAYSADDYCDVLEFSMEPTKCGKGMAVKYMLRDSETQQIFKAWEVHWPHNHENRGSKMAWNTFVKKHVHADNLRKQVFGMKSINDMMANVHLFMAPSRVTHRKIGNGKKDAITNKIFSTEI